MLRNLWWFPLDLYRYRRYRGFVLLLQQNMKFNDPVSFREWRSCYYLNPRHPEYFSPASTKGDTK
jgi:hypothetical protein